MKKIVLSLAGVMAAIAFAPEAAAVPVFARQTGMACSACHFQHFPLLNGFGRAFKAAGFTMMGAQGKVESDGEGHGSALSMPNQLNMGVLTTTVYQQESGATAAPKWMVPSTGGELSLFIGGRIAEFAGFLAEAGLGAGGANAITATTTVTTIGVATPVTGTAAAAPAAGAAKLALLFPVGDARVGMVIHSSNGQGVAYSYETLNTGAVNTHKLAAQNGPTNQHVKVYSASQYFGTATAATGISLVANNSMGFIVLGKYEAAGNKLVGGANTLPLTYLRVAATMDVAGWDAGFGIQAFSGTSTITGSNTKLTVLDGQMQGELGGMPAGLYASYANAPSAVVNPLAPAAAAAVTFNAGPNAASSFNIGGEIGIIPHVSTLQLALRSATTGAAINNKDNAIMVGATYELAQNMELSLTHTTQSGTAWNAVAGVVPVGKSATTLMLEALF